MPTANDTTNAVVLTHDIPNPIRLDAGMVAEAEATIAALEKYSEATDENAAQIEHLTRSVATSERKLEDDRKTLKRGPLELGRRIDAACNDLGTRLNLAKRRGAAILDARQQRKLAEARAAEEAQRRAVEEAARIAEERRMADEAALAALQASGEPLTPEEAVVVAELEAEATVQRELQAVVPLPVVPAVPKSAAGRSMVDELVITDEDAIPRSINGIPLFKRDDAAIKRILKAGIKLPGCHLEKKPQLSVRGY
jgi:hypothetical protein